MKAIVTKYHGPTNTRGSRFSATAEGVGRIYKPYNYGQNADENHYAAALQLANKHGWLKDGTRLVGGGLPDGGCVWVFVRPDEATARALNTLLSVREVFQGNEAPNRTGAIMGVISRAMDEASEALAPKGGE